MNGRYQNFHRLVERFRRQLEELAGSGSEAGGIATTARAMLLLDQGFSLRDTAYATGMGTARVEHFRRRFVCLGLPGLSDAPPLSTQRSRATMATWSIRGRA
jgi:hypothetical protein